MGYIRNQCIVVSGWSNDRVMKAHEAACVIYNNHGVGSLVGGLTQHSTNGGAAFLVAPDGSKEGWERSDIGDKAREELIVFLRQSADLYLDWCELLIGGDDGEFRVLQSPADASAEAAA